MSMKDLYTIQEFAHISGIEASTLRYWDDIGLFSPIRRNPDNNYLYYSLAQLLALNFVTVLSDLDIPLKTIAELRQSRDPEKFLELLEKQEKVMDMEMRRLRLRYSIIHARRELINHGLKADLQEIAVLRREELTIRLWPRNVYQADETFVEPLAAFINHAGEQHVNLSFPVGGYYDNMKAFAEGTDRPQHFFSVDPVGLQSIVAGAYLTGYTRGYYGEMGDLPERMLNYAEENALSIYGPVYATYLLEETCIQDHSAYLAQVCVAVSRTKKVKRFDQE